MTGRKDEIVWLDKGWQPYHLGFCPTECAWNREMKRRGATNKCYLSLGRDAQCSYFDETKEDYAGAIICIADSVDDLHREDPHRAVAIIVHEAVHIWQAVREYMGEKEPSREFEAYSIQAITQRLYGAYLDTRIKKGR